MTTVRETATRDDLWHYLAAGIVDDHLPGPTTVRVDATVASVELDNSTDLHTWIAWLGCGPVGREQWRNVDTVTHYWWSETTWGHGWTVRVQRYTHEPVKSTR